jgi:hypothetical protein
VLLHLLISDPQVVNRDPSAGAHHCEHAPLLLRARPRTSWGYMPCNPGRLSQRMSSSLRMSLGKPHTRGISDFAVIVQNRRDDIDPGALRNAKKSRISKGKLVSRVVIKGTR